MYSEGAGNAGRSAGASPPIAVGSMTDAFGVGSHMRPEAPGKQPISMSLRTRSVMLNRVAWSMAMAWRIVSGPDGRLCASTAAVVAPVRQQTPLRQLWHLSQAWPSQQAGSSVMTVPRKPWRRHRNRCRNRRRGRLQG